MNAKRIVASILVGSVLLTGATLFVLPASAQSAPPRPALTPTQVQELRGKAQARARDGVPAPQRRHGAAAQRNPPVRRFTSTVTTTKAELLALWRTGWSRDQAYLARVVRDQGAVAAAQLREQYEARRRQIEALPDGPVALSAPGIEVGHHSIEWWSHSYDNPLVNGPPGDGVKDPVQTIFFNVGSAWDVQFDLRNWTSRQWRLTDCGGTQYMYIFDADHDGGYTGWRIQDYQLEPEDSTNLCGQPRDHVRLFQSLVEDSHGEYGIWSGGTPHHDNTGHGCPDDWDGPRARVRDSFRDPSTGAPLWFVTDVWEEYLGPEGQNQCDYWEGFVTFINLNQ